MAKAILICGKICSGKTIYAQMLTKKNKAILLSVDELTLDLFENNFGEKHNEIIEKAKNYLYKKSLEIINAGISIIMDWGFWTQDERQHATKYFMGKGIKTEWHYIDTREDERQKNIVHRNKGLVSGQNGSYFIDDLLTEKFFNNFEEPKPDEIDVWHKNEWAWIDS